MNRRRFVANASLAIAGSWAAPLLGVGARPARGATEAIAETHISCVLREPALSSSERRESSGSRKGTMSSPRFSQKASSA